MISKVTSAVLATGLLAGGAAITIVNPGLASAQVPDETSASEAPENHDGDHKRGPRGQRLEGLADILGIEKDELKESLRSGESLVDIAAANGLSEDELTAAMLAAQAERLATAVEDGKITQEQADKASDKLSENIDKVVNGEIKPGGPTGHRGEGLADMAELLGVDADVLKESLKSGESLADIAEANGVDAEDVVDALITAMTNRLNTAIEDGKVDEDRAAEIAAAIEDKAEAIANGEMPPPGQGGGRGHGPRGEVSSEVDAA